MATRAATGGYDWSELALYLIICQMGSDGLGWGVRIIAGISHLLPLRQALCH